METPSLSNTKETSYRSLPSIKIMHGALKGQGCLLILLQAALLAPQEMSRENRGYMQYINIYDVTWCRHVTHVNVYTVRSCVHVIISCW